MYITTTIPYVNARPHLGFALEIVQADVLARHHRRLGEQVRFQTGTDDNSLKNVLAAEAAGVPVRDLVARNSEAFHALRGPLELSFDAFVRTSADPGHRAGVEELWAATAHDVYQKHYEGLYCVGCEQFYPDDHCPDGHAGPLQRVAERNWFFRLSRYQDRLIELIERGELRIEPAARRNEVLAFLRAGVEDISISRSAERARGWGIPVPGDPTQVIYVWWDALANYVTALEDYERWWVREPRRTHLLGKGVIRFHAVYWPAMLLSAGRPLPTELFVHDYLTIGGRKISKSGGATADPAELAAVYGGDALRWWLLREVPRVGDVDFTEERLAARHDEDLANGLGNLVSRVLTLIGRRLDGHAPEPAEVLPACLTVAERVGEALDAFDFRRAAGAVWEIVTEANAYIERTQPWKQADPAASLGTLLHACRTLAEQLAPFLPGAAARVAAQVHGVRLARPEPLFPRLVGGRTV
ncbi:methionine--tRNA ligase [Nonomuraea sp. NPDC050310]|uniref:methionine--tRNA ligase n=1 Tax=unclassified Nonomuraea TaxID=2593643 RepID=UPI0033C0D5AE